MINLASRIVDQDIIQIVCYPIAQLLLFYNLHIRILILKNVVTISTWLTWLAALFNDFESKHTSKSRYWLHDTHTGAVIELLIEWVSSPQFTSRSACIICIRIQYLQLSLGVSFVIYPNNWHNCKSHPTIHIQHLPRVARVTHSTA